MARRSREVLCGVSAAKSAATSSGPMVAKKVVRATSAVSIMAGTRRGRAAASWQGAVAASSGAAGDDGGAPCAMFEWGKRGNVMLPAIKTQRLRMLLEHYLEVRGTRRMPSDRKSTRLNSSH